MAKDSYLGYRIVAHALIFYAHVNQCIVLSARFNRLLPLHPELKKVEALNLRFATIWNVFLQVMYSILALTCDVSAFLNKESAIPKRIRNFRHYIFSALVFPLGQGIFCAFWPIYIYDRELIFPRMADLVITFGQNLVCHAAEYAYVVWELATLPRDATKREPTGVRWSYAFSLVYVFMLLYTRFVDLGVWCYDILTVTEGSILFLFAMGLPFSTPILSYYTQWYMKDAIWKLREIKKTAACQN